MENKKMSIDELSEKILQGTRNALKKLAETSAANNEELVIEDKDGTIKDVPAKQLLETLQQS